MSEATMKSVFLLFAVLFSLPFVSFAQIPYYFTDTVNDRDIQAFWYNVRPDSITETKSGEKYYVGSSIQVYCKTPADTFMLSVETYLKNDKKIFERSFKIEKDSVVFAAEKEKIGCKHMI